MFEKIREFNYRKKYNELQEQKNNATSRLSKTLAAINIGSLKNEIAMATIEGKVSEYLYYDLFMKKG